VIANGAEAAALASSRQMTAPDDEQKRSSTLKPSAASPGDLNRSLHHR
jgi:hypothetical protein